MLETWLDPANGLWQAWLILISFLIYSFMYLTYIFSLALFWVDSCSDPGKGRPERNFFDGLHGLLQNITKWAFLHSD